MKLEIGSSKLEKWDEKKGEEKIPILSGGGRKG
jgi:hypothetical protein